MTILGWPHGRLCEDLLRVHQDITQTHAIGQSGFLAGRRRRGTKIQPVGRNIEKILILKSQPEPIMISGSTDLENRACH
jgi:hypothetical protein